MTSKMVTDLNNTGKRKRIDSKHKITTSEIDNMLLSEIGTHNILRRYPKSDSPYLPPKYTSKMSTLQSSEKTTRTKIMILKRLKLPMIMMP